MYNGRLTRWLVGFLYFYIVVMCAAVVNDFMFYRLFKRVADGFYTDDRLIASLATDSFSTQANMGILQTITFTIIMGISLFWIFKAHKNLTIIGAKNLRFSNAASIVWYFIPILNFFMPYRTMREIWKGSANPKNWDKEKIPFKLTLWWLIWIFVVLFNATVSTMKEKISSYEQINQLSGFLMLNDVAIIALTISYIWVIKNIYRMQKEQMDKIQGN